VVAKRSVSINGKNTSVSLEDEFWDAVKSIALDGNVKVDVIVNYVAELGEGANLSSSLRLFVLSYYRGGGPKRIRSLKLDRGQKQPA
jgi:predicted DNA-binding ribbon-helix-helix protein